jgi:hypothetical protein
MLQGKRHNKCMHLEAESPKSFLCEVVVEEIQFEMESSANGTRRRQYTWAPNYQVKNRKKMNQIPYVLCSI